MPAKKKNNNIGGTTPPARDVNASQRATMAVKLRASKMSYDAIANQCGYADRGACYHAVQREMQRVVVENVDELRREEALTLDLLQVECMKLFLSPDNKGRLFAADRILAVMDRRARLFGLDKAQDEMPTNQVIIREVPAGYLGAAPAVVEVKGG